MPESPPKRLSSSARKEEILQAALGLLATGGLKGFSLEAVARASGVALSLPRHYFGGTDELLKVATERILRQVENVFLSAEDGVYDANSFDAYLQILAGAPWVHEAWMRAAELHPELDAIVRMARRRMTESMYGRPWNALTIAEKIDGRGRIGYIEAVVAEWLGQGMKNRSLVISALVRAYKVTARRTTSKAA